MFKRVVKIAPLLFSRLICKQLDLHQKDTPKWFWFAKHQSDCQHCCIVVIYTLNTQNYASCNGLSSIKLKLFMHRRLLTKRYQWGSIILRSMPSVSFNKMSIHSLCQSNWPSFCSRNNTLFCNIVISSSVKWECRYAIFIYQILFATAHLLKHAWPFRLPWIHCSQLFTMLCRERFLKLILL